MHDSWIIRVKRTILLIALLAFILGLLTVETFAVDGNEQNKVETGIDTECNCNFEKTYFANGKLKSVVYFKNGFRTGTWDFYSEDGSLFLQVTNMEESIPQDDKTLHGLFHYYYKDMLTYMEHWYNGEKLSELVVIPGLYEEMKDSESATVYNTDAGSIFNTSIVIEK